MTLALALAALVGLLLLNAFFVAAEYGLVTARRTKIVELQQQGNRRARDVLTIVSRPPRFIAAMQLGVTLTSLGIGALGEPVLAEVLDPVLATFLAVVIAFVRSEEHTSELQSPIDISYAVFCLKKKKKTTIETPHSKSRNPHKTI